MKGRLLCWLKIFLSTLVLLGFWTFYPFAIVIDAFRSKYRYGMGGRIRKDYAEIWTDYKLSVKWCKDPDNWP